MKWTFPEFQSETSLKNSEYYFENNFSHFNNENT